MEKDMTLGKDLIKVITMLIIGIVICVLVSCVVVVKGKDIMPDENSMTQETQTIGVDFYKELADESATINMYDTANLNAEILENRNGTLIIERCIGKCADIDGNGYVLEFPDEYISYKNVENVKPGDTILTYFIYNPNTNYADDIMYRYDYVLDENEK